MKRKTSAGAAASALQDRSQQKKNNEKKNGCAGSCKNAARAHTKIKECGKLGDSAARTRKRIKNKKKITMAPAARERAEKKKGLEKLTFSM